MTWPSRALILLIFCVGSVEVIYPRHLLFCSTWGPHLRSQGIKVTEQTLSGYPCSPIPKQTGICSCITRWTNWKWKHGCIWCRVNRYAFAHYRPQLFDWRCCISPWADYFSLAVFIENDHQASRHSHWLAKRPYKHCYKCCIWERGSLYSPLTQTHLKHYYISISNLKIQALMHLNRYVSQVLHLSTGSFVLPADSDPQTERLPISDSSTTTS
jgi:hypothetical protein